MVLRKFCLLPTFAHNNLPTFFPSAHRSNTPTICNWNLLLIFWVQIPELTYLIEYSETLSLLQKISQKRFSIKLRLAILVFQLQIAEFTFVLENFRFQSICLLFAVVFSIGQMHVGHNFLIRSKFCIIDWEIKYRNGQICHIPQSQNFSVVLKISKIRRPS